MNPIQTTGGVFTEKIKNEVVRNICTVFQCQAEDIENLQPVQEGMTNIVLSFNLNGGKFVYRYPGLGSEALVNRGRETIMQTIVAETGIDTTLVAMDVDRGWKIARYIEHREFNYHDLNDMVRAIMLLRRLHEIPCKVRWNFDVIQKAEEIKEKIPFNQYGKFNAFEDIKERCYQLYELAQNDGIPLCNVHGDARDVNFLINKEEIFLTDWEYGGYGDPGFDLGSYICGGNHSIEEIEMILFTYYRRKPTYKQRRHFYAYIALTGWFYIHWTMLKESRGQKVGIHKELWYQYALRYSEIALEMYKNQEEK